MNIFVAASHDAFLPWSQVPWLYCTNVMALTLQVFQNLRRARILCWCPGKEGTFVWDRLVVTFILLQPCTNSFIRQASTQGPVVLLSFTKSPVWNKVIGLSTLLPRDLRWRLRVVGLPSSKCECKSLSKFVICSCFAPAFGTCFEQLARGALHTILVVMGLNIFVWLALGQYLIVCTVRILHRLLQKLWRFCWYANSKKSTWSKNLGQ